MRIVRNVRQVAYVMVVLLLAGTLAACSGGGGDSGGESRAVDKGGGAAAPEARTGAGRNAEPGARTTPQAPLAGAREVVHTARLRVRADDVDASATKAKQMVAAVGGYVERESSSTDPARSEITLKIPTPRYTDLLNQLSTQLGAKLSLTQEAEDVTGEVADVAARVRSAEATLASFRKLLERANSVSEIINVEQEIAERESDLEALQAREKALKSSTQYATVTVMLVTKITPPEEKDDEGGFVDALGDGWNAFAAFLGGIAILLAWLLPFLVLAAVIATPVVMFRHRLRARFGIGTRPPAPGGPGPQPPLPETAAAGSAPSRPSGPSGPESPQGPPPPA
ncbi:DUF4349 domain-containing protein [Actinomadura sp. KC216]|uniref:DUF4349 domain-containing protein n=1 Tax=Actinomadura sp. KC216 TaxID=2530370 RepID=UPI001046F107|nr:DUF4349 domain-containing protein [Actinomadura sp. KC216]TDB84121.1 DUF4349 domain-containing protein [Actinomadura sp. KC216]